jgi:DnaJ-class molecular chaperone
MRDPYEVLGVAKGADAAAIKSAFRKQAKKLHPDANKQDPKAASKFAELNAAYEILGDEDKRKAFDRGEIDAEGKPRFQGFAGAGAQPGGREGFESFTWGSDGFQRRGGRGGAGARGGFEDILKDMFGNMSGRRGARGAAGMEFEPEESGSGRGADISADITITLPEAANGGSKRLRLSNGKELDVKIPAGLTDGQTIRLKGQGVPGPDGSTGDLLIRIAIASHPIFKLDGINLRLDLPVTLYEAELGAKVRVPTLDGAVDLTIPPKTNSGRTFRLKGKGIASKQGTGDLFATVLIMLPERSDPEFDQLMRKWRDSHPYNPRRDID